MEENENLWNLTILSGILDDFLSFSSVLDQVDMPTFKNIEILKQEWVLLHKKPLRENNQLDLKISSNQAFWTRFNKKEKNTAT